MSLKEFLIKKIALENNLPVRTVEAIINHEFLEAFKATTEHKSIEISGFGKFLFNEKKAQKTYIKFQEQMAVYTKTYETLEPSSPEYKRLTTVISNLKKNMEHLKLKLDETK